MICDQQGVIQLADMLKAMGHPLRIQIITILVKERIVSIPTLQDYLPGVDQFLIYSNLRYMHKKHLVKKLRKGREIYFGLSEKAISAGFDTFFKDRFRQNSTRIDDKAVPVPEISTPRETHVFA